MARLFFNYSGEDLARLFGEQSEERATLRALLEELQHRTTPKMRVLQEQVERKLAALETGTSRKSNDEAPAAIPVTSAREPDLGSATIHRSEIRSSTTAAATEDSGVELETKDDVPGSAGLKSGELGSIRPCGGLIDVPSKRQFPEKTDLTLDVPNGAPLQIVYRSALSALIQEMKRKGTGSKRITVEDGRFVPLDGRENGYRFRIEGDEELFEGAGVTAFIGSHRVEGRIVSVLAGEIVVTLAEHFGSTIHSAVLQVDNTAMLQALADRLEKVNKGEVTLNLDLARDTIGNAGSELPLADVPAALVAKHELNLDQANAVRMALANSVTYLWGPPGTGKTYSLAALLELLFEEGKRTLICSNTNQAVDQVLLKVCDGLTVSHPALEDGRIVRVGRVSHPELADKYSEYVTLDGIVKRKSATLRSEKENLEHQIGAIRTCAETARRIVEAYARLDNHEAEVTQREADGAKAISGLSKAQTEVQRLSQQATDLQEALKEWSQAGFMRRLMMRSEQAITANIARVSQGQQEAARITSAATQAVASSTVALQRVRATRDELRDALKSHDRQAAERVLQDAETKIAPLQSRLVEVNKQLDDIAKAVMDEARVVGATVTKCYLSPQLFTRFDAVIVDEASMVMLPALFHAVSLAASKAVISGDFRQLAPIVTSDQKTIRDLIGRDVFHSAGIADAFEGGRNLKRTVMLKTQYRMVEPICGLVNQRMYAARLSTQASLSSEIPLPFPYDAPLVLIDTSALSPFVNRDLFGSRFNLMNALVIRNLCRHLVDAGSVFELGDLGICTPYAAQAKIMRRILAGHRFQKRIEAGTIHRYQGDEKNTIIVDIPDSLGEPSVGIFLEADHPDEDGAKLFNVAATRAKQHLLLVGNLAYLDRRLPDNAFVREILHNVFSRGRVVDARDVLALWPIEQDLRQFGREFNLASETLERGLFRDRDFQTVCMADVEAAKESVAIFSGFVTPQRVAVYADLFRRKLQEGVKIRCVTRPPKHNGTIPEDQGREALDALERLGCVVDTRWDIHEKVMIIDDAVVWFGSLNPLSHAGRTDEMMARLEGHDAALQLAAFLSLNRRADANSAAGLSVTRENPQCPDCESRTTYRKGRYGPYWQCEAQCGWTESVDKPKRQSSNVNPLPKELAPPCPKCGAQTVPRVGRFGAFYGCTRYPDCDGVAKPSKKSPASSRAQHPRSGTSKRGSTPRP